MNDKVKRITEIFGWMLFLGIYATLLLGVLALLQSPGVGGWWDTQGFWMKALIVALGFVSWCVYTLIMFMVFWGFNWIWLKLNKKLMQYRQEIEKMKKEMQNAP